MNEHEPVVAPPAGHPRFPQVDGVRAIAALSIFAFHIAGVSGALYYGWAHQFTQHLNLVGVPIFFVISAFVLYRPFVASRFGAPERSLADYARKRFLRIVPGYWVALTLSAALLSLAGIFTSDWPWYYGFAQVYSSRRAPLGLPTAWTLAVEVSFYLMLPLYALLMQRVAGTRRGWLKSELGALAVLALASQLANSQIVHLSTIVSTFPWFAAGMALAVFSVNGKGRYSALVADYSTACWLLALGLYAVMCLWFTPLLEALRVTLWQNLAIYTLWVAAIAVLVILPAVNVPLRERLPQRVLRIRVLAWLGVVSYGLYLYHAPVLVWVESHGLRTLIPGQRVLSYVVVALPATVACAAVSYYLIEKPALTLRLPLRGWRRRRLSAPAGVYEAKVD
jgi:peptidoglycan/LPS O-acetylase OafA/YrhL